MENKKTKLTISGNPKNKIRSFQTNKSKGQKTVFIDKNQISLTVYERIDSDVKYISKTQR